MKKCYDYDTICAYIENDLNPIKDILSNTVVNTIVLDVKSDNGQLLYDSEITEVEKLNNKRIKYDAQTLKSFNFRD